MEVTAGGTERVFAEDVTFELRLEEWIRFRGWKLYTDKQEKHKQWHENGMNVVRDKNV